MADTTPQKTDATNTLEVKPADEDDNKAEQVPTLKPGVYTERESAFRSNLDEEKTEALQSDDTEVGPYFRAFSKRRQNHKDLLSKQTTDDGAFSAETYLKKVIAKYDVSFDFSDEDFPMVNPPEDQDEEEMQPWIQGIMRKKLPPDSRGGMLSWFKSAYQYKFVRLYPDALLWFEVPSFWKRKGWSRDSTAKPQGILPLALISGVKAPGLAEIMAYDEDPLKDDEAVPDIDESALTVIELELGKGQGVVKLRAEDWRQRLKWLECLNIAIFDSDKKGRGEISRVSKLTQGVLKVQREVDTLNKIKEGSESSGSSSDEENDKEENHGVLELASGLFAVIRDKTNTIRADENTKLPVL